jgi:hypothetical protein
MEFLEFIHVFHSGRNPPEVKTQIQGFTTIDSLHFLSIGSSMSHVLDLGPSWYITEPT